MGISDLLFRKEKEVERKLLEYLDHWLECVGCFEQGMASYLTEGPGEQIDYFYARVDKEESKGDELRQSIETELFAKALLPEARGDIMRSLESMDLVINRCESTIRQLVIERLEIEPWMKNGMERLTAETVDAAQVLHKVAGHVLRAEAIDISEMAARIDRIETRCDHLEEDIIGRVFAGDLELARKLQLKDFVRRVGTIADFCESSADRLNIIALKRRV